MLNIIRNLPHRRVALVAVAMFAAGLVVWGLTRSGEPGHGEGEHAEEAASGPHGGRLLIQDDFAIELAIFERGVPPRFRAWATDDGDPIEPGRVELQVQLQRLGGKQDRFAFVAQDGFLEGQGEVEEPHSFDVSVHARFEGRDYEWRYASPEGRVEIPAAVAQEAGITTVAAGPATIAETVPLYGVVKPDAERVRRLTARYPGLVREVMKRAGDPVRKGEALATVENNDSLQTYTVRSPIDGVIVERHVNAGEAAGDAPLFTVADTSSVWIELQVFHRDVGRVKRGQRVRVGDFEGELEAEGRVVYLAPVGSPASQSVIARVLVPNADAHLMPGLYVTGEVVVAEHAVPVAAPVAALQSFRDREVVFERVGETYEVRMPQFGRRDGRWVEVISGLAAGAEVVATQSYLVKADIEKSGASHDH